MTTVEELAARLKNSDAKVRRLAVMDLANAGDAGLVVLVEHLQGEADEKAALLIVRALERARFQAARPALARMRDNPATPARVYHAAVLADDALERVGA